VDGRGPGGGGQHLQQIRQPQGDQDAGHRHGQGEGADLLGHVGGVEVQGASRGDQHEQERDGPRVLHDPVAFGDADHGGAQQQHLEEDQGHVDADGEQPGVPLAPGQGRILGGVAQGEEREGEGGGGDAEAEQQGGAEDGAQVRWQR
jgi:hypothetical protein